MRALLKQNAGFSLIWVGIALAAAGLVIAASLPGGSLGNDSEKQRITAEHMQKIEEATRAFMATNLRRPCPADGSQAQSSSTFGVEAANPGSCTGGTPVANFVNTSSVSGATITQGASMIAVTSTNISLGSHVENSLLAPGTVVTSIVNSSNITVDPLPIASGINQTLNLIQMVGGTVPTRSLGLSDDYALDGYGRRITYMVDPYATGAQTCHDMQSTRSKGIIQILPGNNVTSVERVMWTLLSHGKNGFGAFPLQGSPVASRMNSVSVNLDERVNALVGPTGFTYNTSYPGTLVKHDPVINSTNSYDDMVWYQDSSKNTCCLGEACQFASVTQFGPDYITEQIKLASGDINGDGISDMVFQGINSSGISKIYVVFGTKKGWAFPPSILNSDTQLNGVNGFTIINSTAPADYSTDPNSVLVADVNGDGYDDIIMHTPQGLAIVFGGPGPITNYNAGTGVTTYGSNWPASVDIQNYTSSYEGINITIPAPNGNLTYPSFFAGDFNGDYIKDILIGGFTAIANSTTDSDVHYVIFGKKGTWSAPTFNGTDGVVISGGGLHLPQTCVYHMGIMSHGLSAGELNGDGFDDIVMQAGPDGPISSCITNSYAFVFIRPKFGRLGSKWR